MKLEQVQNGFLVTKANGDLFVYKTLREAVDDIEGRDFVPVNMVNGTRYALGCNVENLIACRRAALAGRKIEAIKELRSCFVPKLGLKEAKELIESMIW